MRKVNQSSDIIFCFMYFVWIFTGFKNYLGSGFFDALKMFMIKTFFRNVFLLLFLVKQRKQQRIIWLPFPSHCWCDSKYSLLEKNDYFSVQRLLCSITFLICLFNIVRFDCTSKYWYHKRLIKKTIFISIHQLFR